MNNPVIKEPTFLDKVLAKLPKPLVYLANVIRGDTEERAAAFLAVISGLALVAGFVAIILAITIYNKHLTTELITVSGALVTLATFNRVDREPTSTTNNKDKEVLKG